MAVLLKSWSVMLFFLFEVLCFTTLFSVAILTVWSTKENYHIANYAFYCAHSLFTLILNLLCFHAKYAFCFLSCVRNGQKIMHNDLVIKEK